MKAILIDPKDQTIRTLSYGGDYMELYQILECRMYECVYPFKNEDTIYIDEEGLLKDSNYSFSIKCDDGRIISLMGKGLILGTDAEGESIEHKTSLEEVKSRITFNGKVAISENDRGFTVMPFDIGEALKNTEGNA